jgi:hypothetical protein
MHSLKRGELQMVDDHETAKVEPWPAEFTADDHPTPTEAECKSALVEAPPPLGYYAMLSDIWLP